MKPFIILERIVWNIHNFANEIIGKLEAIFIETIDTKELKRKLLDMVVNNFDVTNNNYDSSFFRFITEKALNDIDFPIITLDFSDKQNEITSKFSGEITSGSQKTTLIQMLSATISTIFNNVAVLVEKEIGDFKSHLDEISESLIVKLLNNIEEEFQAICKHLEDKESKIKRIEMYISELSAQIEIL